MRSFVLKLTCFLLSLAAAAVACAQTESAPLGSWDRLDGPAIERLPAVENTATGFASFGPESIAAPAAQSAVNAAPPPDPSLPKWGDFNQPRPVPWNFPQRLYELIGPPRGIFQPNTGQAYQQSIAEPNEVPAIDNNLTIAIDLCRPDGLAPTGVVGANMLRTGRLLFTAEYSQGIFDQNYVGFHRVSAASILNSFPYAQRQLFQQTENMFLSYGVTDDLTLQFNMPFEQSSLNYSNAGGGSSNASFAAQGDVKVTALYSLYRQPGAQIHLNFGMSVPTGQLNPQNLPISQSTPNFPYVIRTSSGTYDLLPGLTYRGQNQSSTWGAQTSGVVHLGTNHWGYQLGDVLDITAWYSRRWSRHWATSARIDGQIWGNIQGADPRLNSSLSAVNQTGTAAGSRINLMFGANFYLPHLRVPGQIFSVEAGFPVYQALDGPQLGLNWLLNAGWNIMF